MLGGQSGTAHSCARSQSKLLRPSWLTTPRLLSANAAKSRNRSLVSCNEKAPTLRLGHFHWRATVLAMATSCQLQ